MVAARRPMAAAPAAAPTMAAEDMFGFKALELELVQALNTRTQQLDQAARANLSLLRDEHRATVARLEATVKQKTDEHAVELDTVFSLKSIFHGYRVPPPATRSESRP
jgi:hypothetical protein